MHRLQVPTTNNPAIIKRLIREVGGVLDTPGFQSWFDLKRRNCLHAPRFDEFWRYVKASLRYDVPGQELCEVAWRATRQAFSDFDATRGNQSKPPRQRFLTHWRNQFHDAVRSTFGKRRNAPNVVPLEQAASRTYMADPFQALLRKTVKGLMDELTGEDKIIIEQHYVENKPLREIALMLHRRNSYVANKHKEVLERMKRVL